MSEGGVENSERSLEPKAEAVVLAGEILGMTHSLAYEKALAESVRNGVYDGSVVFTTDTGSLVRLGIESSLGGSANPDRYITLEEGVMEAPKDSGLMLWNVNAKNKPPTSSTDTPKEVFKPKETLRTAVSLKDPRGGFKAGFSGVSLDYQKSGQTESSLSPIEAGRQFVSRVAGKNKP